MLALLMVAAAFPLLTAASPAEARTTPAKCTVLQQLLGPCAKPTTTTTTKPPTTSSTTTPGGACGGYATVPKTGGGVWTCAFSDEFNGTTLNRAMWLPQTTKGSGFSSNAQDCFMDSPNNVSVSGGDLVLTSRQEPAPFVCEDTVPRTTQYTSGSVSTYQRMSVDHGRVEVRAKIISAKVQGTHTAFWLFPQDLIGGPGRGEIDIAEVYGIYSDRAIPFIHSPLEAVDSGATNDYCMIPNIADWNTYVVEWTAQSIKIIYNGQVCLTDTLAASNFNKDYMVALTQGLGWPGNAFQPGITPLPAQTLVDYVRVYK
ncbi:MAG: glycoside hydrolase family 16 protein [Mycobacterium sp.]